jgi:hypothetical protein
MLMSSEPKVDGEGTWGGRVPGRWITDKERKENEEDNAARRGEDLLDGPADWDEDE